MPLVESLHLIRLLACAKIHLSRRLSQSSFNASFSFSIYKKNLHKKTLCWKQSENGYAKSKFSSICLSSFKIILFGARLFKNAFFADFRNKFGKTKQIKVALVAAALKARISVSKISVGHAGCKLHTACIDYLFLNIFTHMILLSAIKKVHNRSYAPKNASSKLSPNELIRKIGIHTIKREPHFYQTGKA